jgi:hypothetical protein
MWLYLWAPTPPVSDNVRHTSLLVTCHVAVPYGSHSTSGGHCPPSYYWSHVVAVPYGSHSTGGGHCPPFSCWFHPCQQNSPIYISTMLTLLVRNFKVQRLKAFSDVIGWQAAFPKPTRYQPRALTLTAVIAWLINALHSAPVRGKSETAMIKACLPHVEDSPTSDSDDDEDHHQELDSSPVNPFGLFLLRNIELRPGCPSVPGTRFLDDDSICYFLDITKDELYAASHNVLQKRKAPAEDHHPNKMRRTTTAIIPDQQQPRFTLADQGHHLEIPAPDFHLADDPRTWIVDDDQDDDGDLDKELEEIWQQFFHDIIQKSPTPRDETLPAFFIGPRSGPQFDPMSPFMNPRLSDNWSSCSLTIASKQEWENTFQCLFPRVVQVMSSTVQNYQQMQYYRRWIILVSRLQDKRETFLAVLKSLKTEFNKLVWLPRASKSRVWDTHYLATQHHFGPNNTTSRPQLILNYHKKFRDLSWTNQAPIRPRPPLAEEEEESSDEN